MPKNILITFWELRNYDVWGNKEDGYEVNDSFVFDRQYRIDLDITVNNPGLPSEFKSAYPTDKQIKDAFGVNCKLELSGDDLTIYVNRASDSYPIGQMHCTSQESLSPIR